MPRAGHNRARDPPTKEPEHFKTTPGGYFHGILAKHITGELHLERTVWALRRTIDPERYPAKQRQSDQRREHQPYSAATSPNGATRSCYWRYSHSPGAPEETLDMAIRIATMVAGTEAIRRGRTALSSPAIIPSSPPSR